MQLYQITPGMKKTKQNKKKAKNRRNKQKNYIWSTSSKNLISLTNTMLSFTKCIKIFIYACFVRSSGNQVDKNKQLTSAKQVHTLGSEKSVFFFLKQKLEACFKNKTFIQAAKGTLYINR
jgi:hypothetical protein